MPLSPTDNLEDPARANMKSNKTATFAVSNWGAYSNVKALLVNDGEEGHIFDGKFNHFIPAAINNMIGMCILDGLAPSPQLIWKIQSQAKQKTHRKDFIAKCIGPGYEQLYCLFRAFLARQDPLTMPPPKKECPNFKVSKIVV